MPLSVSASSDRDTLEVHFKSEKFFVDQEDGLALSGNSMLVKKLPR